MQQQQVDQSRKVDYLEIEALFDGIISGLDQLGKPNGLIITDIMKNDFWMVRASIMPSQELNLVSLKEFLNTIQQCVTNLQVSVRERKFSLYNPIDELIKNKNINQILQCLNIFIRNRYMDEYKRNIQLEQFEFGQKEFSAQLITFIEKGKELGIQNEPPKGCHQLTALFKACQNNYELQKKLLYSIAKFIVPDNSHELQAKFYVNLFRTLGVSANNAHQVSEKQIENKMNDFFSNFWLNRKYLLRIFQRNLRWGESKEEGSEHEYYKINKINLRSFRSDHYEEIVSDEVNLQLLPHKIQIIGEKKERKNNQPCLQTIKNSHGNYPSLLFEPYHTNGFYIKTLDRGFSCMMQKRQEYTLKYLDTDHQYQIKSGDSILTIKVESERIMFKQQILNNHSNNQLNEIDQQFDSSTLETPTPDSDNSLFNMRSLPEYSYSTIENQSDKKEKDNTFNYQEIMNSPDKLGQTKSNNQMGFASTRSYFDNYESKRTLKLFKGEVTSLDQRPNKIFEFYTDKESKQDFILKENIVRFKFRMDSTTKEVKVSQKFYPFVSTQHQCSYFQIPDNSYFQLQDNTLIMTPLLKKYQFTYQKQN